MNPPSPQNQFHMPTMYPHYYTPTLQDPLLNQIPNSNPNYTNPSSSSSSQLPVYASCVQSPGVESSNFVSTHQQQHFPPPSLSCYEAAQAAAAAAYQQQIQEWQAAQFHHNPDAVGVSLTSAATEGTAMGTVSALNPSAQQTYPVVQPNVNGTALNKGSKKNKKTKVVQSAYCEVCKIECTSLDAFAQHISGKKHKKSLEKVNEARQIAAQPPQVVVAPPPPVVVTAPVIGPQQKPSKKKKAALSSKESLDTKRRKLWDGGTAVEAVRICTVCNVVCNSQTVFHYHLAGHKHAAMVKKLTAAGTIVT